MYEHQASAMYGIEEEYGAASWYGTLMLLSRYSENITDKAIEARGGEGGSVLELCRSLGTTATSCTLSILSSWAEQPIERSHKQSSAMARLGIFKQDNEIHEDFLNGYSIYADHEFRKWIFNDTSFGRLEEVITEVAEYHAPIIETAMSPGVSIVDAVGKTNLEINIYTGLYDPARPLPCRPSQRR